LTPSISTLRAALSATGDTYEAMDILGIEPKASAIAEFNDKLNVAK
jgi:hypothetical protein